MPETTKVTFSHVGGISFNLALPDSTYRTFDNGFLVTDDADPWFAYLMDWAQQRAEITVVMNGEVRQRGMLVCGECGRLIDDRTDREEAEAAHAAQFHANKDEEENQPVRKTRARRRG